LGGRGGKDANSAIHSRGFEQVRELHQLFIEKVIGRKKVVGGGGKMIAKS